jgi:hypothetical protein
MSLLALATVFLTCEQACDEVIGEVPIAPRIFVRCTLSGEAAAMSHTRRSGCYRFQNAMLINRDATQQSEVIKKLGCAQQDAA